jgi:hypothetical protein
MARIRSVKPEFWSDPEMTRLPRDVRFFYVALWNFADEDGRLSADTRYLKTVTFPLDDDVTEEIITGWLRALAQAGRVELYVAQGKAFAFLPKLAVHQNLSPEKQSKHLPAPSDQDVQTSLDFSGLLSLSLPSRALTKERTTLTINPPTSNQSDKNGDELFSAMCEATEVEAESVTSSERAVIDEALLELVAVGATGAEVLVRARRYHQRWPKMPVTPRALSKHWGNLARDPPASSDRTAEIIEKTMRNGGEPSKNERLPQQSTG